MKMVYLPVPYPGECLYSVFCRYHVRSGNTPAQTAAELTGYNMLSFERTVVSTGILFRPRSQHLEVRGMSTADLIMGNTAFQYFSLTLLTEGHRKIGTALDAKPQGDGDLKEARFYSQIRESQKINLFYCPACAQEERQIYGEPYWHTLHQLQGVEYCHIHQIPLEESRADIRQKGGIRFYPAYMFAKEKASCKSDDYKYKKGYISIAEDINWLLNNGWRLGGIEKIRNRYLKLLNDKWANMIEGVESYVIYFFACEEADQQYNGSLPQEFLERLCLPYAKWNILAAFPYCFTRFTPLQHAVYMRGHFGGAMEFFKEYY